MTNQLLQNSYNILGLDNAASEKEVLRRSKEISNLLKIDEVQEFASDIGSVKDFRTEHKVKESVQKLSEPKKRIKEYFFWFDIQDEVDENAISQIRSKNYPNAIKIWKEGSLKNTPKSFFYKKNLALLYTLILSMEDDNEHLNVSLELWDEVIKSEKFWDMYIKVYALNDSLNTSSEVIHDFKKQVSTYLSDIYTELSQKKGSNYIAEFNRVFGVKGKSLEKNVLNPIYNSINDTVEELEAMNISEDGIVDDDEIKKVKSLIKKLQEELNKIIDLGLYEDSQTKLIRDRAATALRRTVLDIYNNLRETDKSIALLNIALNISGTASLSHKIEEDIKTIEKNKKNDEIVEPILELIKEEKIEEALLLIKKGEKENHNNSDLQTFYTYHKKMCISTLAAEKYKLAHEKFSNKNFDDSKIIFNELRELLENNIDLYDFDKDGLNNLVDKVKTRIAEVNASNLSEVDDLRDQIRKMANEKFEEQYESPVLIFLIDAYIYTMLADYIKEIRNKANIANVLYWIAVIVFFWQWWLGLLIFAGAWIYKNKS